MELAYFKNIFTWSFLLLTKEFDFRIVNGSLEMKICVADWGKSVREIGLEMDEELPSQLTMFVL